MKKIKYITACILLLAMTLSLCACNKPSVESEVKPLLLDADVAPSEGFSAAKYDIKTVFENDEYSDEDKATEIWKLACFNEPHADHFAFFLHTDGTTSISEGSGKMVYQKYHIQSQTQKYEQILKCVPSHNFDGGIATIAESALQTGKINLVTDGKLYRFANADTPTYDEETKLISVPWEKGKDWGSSDPISKSQKETVKANFNTSCFDILSSATLESKTDDAGNVYYRVVMVIDPAVANDDRETLDALDDANSPARNVKYKYLTVTYEVWESGFLKYYRYDESWEGKMFGMAGSSVSVAECHYSYSARDCDLTEKLKLIEQIDNAS